MTTRRLRRAFVAVALALFATPATWGKPARPAKAARRKPPAAPRVQLEEHADRPASPPDASEPPDETPSTKQVNVTVVEIAGGQAYLQPGTQGGVHRGATVTFNRHDYVVVQATDSFAAILVGDRPLREHDRGTATTVRLESSGTRKLDAPKPLATWKGEWKDATPPADDQHPRFVPLGTTTRDRRFDVRLTALGGALLPLQARGSNLVRAELDARVHATPFTAPVALDADVAVQRWFDANLSNRSGSPGRPLVFVRELLAGYGTGGYYAGAGRMRYAARTLGTLDGARVAASLGDGVSVGAFGGILPDPTSGAPSTVANRFGVEMTYTRLDAPLRPDAALVLSGSMFGGKLDERRLSGAVNVYPGPSRMGAHFEVSAFDRGNPWNASPIELTAAGADSSVRAGPFEFGGRIDVRKPERSRWLGSYFPLSWFCTTVPATGAAGAPERCGSTNTLAFGTLDAGVELDRWSVVVGATRSGDLSQSGAANAFGTFAAARVVRLARVLRLEASGNYSKATYLDALGVGGGPGVTLLDDALDVGVYYRVGTLEYRSAPGTSLVQHTIGSSVVVIPEPSLLFAAQGEAVTGDDTRALVLFGTATWRPEL
ncbi:MAG TPA: hypothetical protein VHE30_16030 [Polyangiaceae bacterium]|nr:hypothetical protein [Polyangiaceae bacterium]